MSDKPTRRVFLGSATSAAVGAGLIANRALAAPKPPKRGANEKLNVGIIGVGGRGGYLAYLFQTAPGARLVAICDVNGKELARIAEQSVKVDPDHGQEVKKIHDYRELLDDKDIDVAVVATNVHWHVLAAIHACQAGKDVYLEKPTGASIGEGRALVETARKHERVVQMGTQQRTWEHYRAAVDIVRSGVLGEISTVEVWDFSNLYPGLGRPDDEDPPPELDWNFWLGPAPEVPYNRNRHTCHDCFFDYGGAWQLAWGHHHYDIVHWAMGAREPISAVGFGESVAFDDNCDWPDTFTGACQYPPGPVAKRGFVLHYTCRSGCSRPRYGRVHAKAFHGTNGSLVVDRGGFELLSELRNDRRTIVEDKMTSGKAEHDVVKDHISGFLDCVRSGKTPLASVEEGHYASNPGHLMNIAWRAGRKIRWDAANERVIDDPEANHWLTKKYREPWSLPAV